MAFSTTYCRAALSCAWPDCIHNTCSGTPASIAVVIPPRLAHTPLKPSAFTPTRSSARGIISENPAGVTAAPCNVHVPPAPRTARGNSGGQ